MDFAALLACSRVEANKDAQWEPAIQAMMNLECPDWIRRADDSWKQCDFYDRELVPAHWVTADILHTKSPRPRLPSTRIWLALPGLFDVAFGIDAMMVYFPLRIWRFFDDQGWRDAMLGAMRALGKMIDARECLISHDCHPAMCAFGSGATYSEALEASTGAEGERQDLEQLYVEDDDGRYDVKGYWIMKM